MKEREDGEMAAVETGKESGDCLSVRGEDDETVWFNLEVGNWVGPNLTNSPTSTTQYENEDFIRESPTPKLVPRGEGDTRRI